MAGFLPIGQSLMMAKRAQPAPKRKKYKPTYIRQWRKYRNMTIEQLAALLEMTPSGLSMLERGQSGYTQERLEQIAYVLRTDAASLLMRNPESEDAIWSIWDNATVAERNLIIDLAHTVKRSRTG